MTTQLALLRTSRFLPMLVTQMTSGFNDNLFKSGFVMVVTFGAASTSGLPPAAIATIAGGLLILPYLLFSAMAGQLADRSERSRLLQILKGAEIVLVIGSATALLTANLPLSFAILFLLGTQATFSSPIKYSLLPQHLAEDELINGNAVMEAGTFLGILIGTIAGGLVPLASWGPIAGAVALVACACTGFTASLFVPRAPAPAPGLVVEANVFASTVRVMREAFANRDVKSAIMASSWFWLMGSVYLAQFPSWAKDRLNADSGVVTLFFAAFSVGVGVGSSLCGRLLHGEVTAKLSPYATIAMAVFSALLFALTPAMPPDGDPAGVVAFLSTGNGWVLFGSLVGIAVSAGVFVVPLYAIMQDRSEETMRARVIAANNIMNAVFMVAAAIAVTGLLARGISIPMLFLLLTAGHLLAGLAVKRMLPG